ncbi:MAG TPA: hypothetical protein PKI14_12720 [Fervidobacterium sp.]|nr:hypothetical protein [Fervidobacterium sp.]
MKKIIVGLLLVTIFVLYTVQPVSATGGYILVSPALEQNRPFYAEVHVWEDLKFVRFGTQLTCQFTWTGKQGIPSGALGSREYRLYVEVFVLPNLSIGLEDWCINYFKQSELEYQDEGNLFLTIKYRF